MQCPKCSYEPTLTELQTGAQTCSRCHWRYSDEYRVAVPPKAGPAPVVIADIHLPFFSAVRLMLTLAVAAIPAGLLFVLIVSGIPAFFKVLF